MRFNARRAWRRQPKLEARHDCARRRACVWANRAGRASPEPPSGHRPVRLRGRARLRFPSRRQSRRLSGRGTAGPLERNATGRVLAGTDGSSFAAQRQRALGGFAFCLAGRLDDERTPSSCERFASVASPAMKGPKSENSGGSVIAGAKAANVGRLVGERAFHFGPSTFAGVLGSPTVGPNAPFAPGGASAAGLTARADLDRESALSAGFSLAKAAPAKPATGPLPSIANAAAPTPIVSRTGAAQSNRVSAARAAAHEAAPTGRKARRLRASAGRPNPDLRRGPRVSGIERQDGRRPAPRSDHVRRAANSANRPVRRAAVGALRRRGVVPTRRRDGQRRTDGRRAARERARRKPRALDAADPRDRRRSFAGRPRGCLDDDAARRRQALCRHPRGELSNSGINRRRARRDRRSHGGDRPAARLAHRQAGRRQQ